MVSFGHYCRLVFYRARYGPSAAHIQVATPATLPANEQGRFPCCACSNDRGGWVECQSAPGPAHTSHTQSCVTPYPASPFHRPLSKKKRGFLLPGLAVLGLPAAVCMGHFSIVWMPVVEIETLDSFFLFYLTPALTPPREFETTSFSLSFFFFLLSPHQLV